MVATVGGAANREVQPLRIEARIDRERSSEEPGDDHYVGRGGTQAPPSESGNAAGRPMGALGIQAVRQRLEELRSSVEIEVPLRAGMIHEPIDVEIKEGTMVKIELQLEPGPNGPRIASGSLRASESLRVLSGNRWLEVHVDGMDIGKNGRVKLDADIRRLSLNPLRHLLSDGKKKSRLLGAVAGRVTPTVDTGVETLALFDIGKLMSALAPIAGPGKFRASINGGDFSAKVGGAFAVRDDGTIAVERTRGTFDSDLIDGRFAVDGVVKAAGGGVFDASLHAVCDAVPDGGGVALDVPGAAVDVMKKLESELGFRIGDALDIAFGGKISSAADLELSFVRGEPQVRVESADVHVELGGSTLSADRAKVELAEGSKVDLHVADLQLSENGARVGEASAVLDADLASGRVAKGPLALQLAGDSKVTASAEITSCASGIEASSSTHYRMAGRPKIAAVSLPVRAAVEGDVKVRLAGGRIEVEANRRLARGRRRT